MRLDRLRTGDVVLLFDATIRSPKHKRFICVVAAEGWFLRINSQRYFRPHLAIGVADNPGCLDHDSFVELRGVIEHDVSSVGDALDRGEARVLGRLSVATALALVRAVAAAPTLTRSEGARIVEALRAAYALPA